MGKINMDKKDKDIRNRTAKTFIDNFEKQLNLVLQENKTDENNSELANTQKKSKENEPDQQFNLSQFRRSDRQH